MRKAVDSFISQPLKMTNFIRSMSHPRVHCRHFQFRRSLSPVRTMRRVPLFSFCDRTERWHHRGVCTVQISSAAGDIMIDSIYFANNQRVRVNCWKQFWCQRHAIGPHSSVRPKFHRKMRFGYSSFVFFFLETFTKSLWAYKQHRAHIMRIVLPQQIVLWIVRARVFLDLPINNKLVDIAQH